MPAYAGHGNFIFYRFPLEFYLPGVEQDRVEEAVQTHIFPDQPAADVRDPVGGLPARLEQRVYNKELFRVVQLPVLEEFLYVQHALVGERHHQRRLYGDVKPPLYLHPAVLEEDGEPGPLVLFQDYVDGVEHPFREFHGGGDLCRLLQRFFKLQFPGAEIVRFAARVAGAGFRLVAAAAAARQKNRCYRQEYYSFHFFINRRTAPQPYNLAR